MEKIKKVRAVNSVEEYEGIYTEELRNKVLFEIANADHQKLLKMINVLFPYESTSKTNPLSIGKKLLNPSELPQGALNRYERDIAVVSYKIGD